MAWENAVAAALTIVPALGLLMYLLRRYEGYFDQRKLFFALLVGLFGGMLVRYLELLLFPFETEQVLVQLGPLYSLAYTAFGYALVAGVAMTAVLGLGRYRLAKDAPFHGTALGASFGGMWMQGTTQGLLLRQGVSVPFEQADWIVMAVDFLLAAGIVLAMATAGMTVGRMSAAGTLRRGILYGTLWLMPAMACYWFFFNSLVHPDVRATWVPTPGWAALGAVAWGIVCMRRTQKHLDGVVPPEIRMQMQRAERREARKQP